MSKKLELTWVGKDKKISVEPRILIENKKLSNIENNENTENMLIHGDNLLALKALEPKYAGKIKCIYIDPPYNTGVAFEHYNDNLEHSIWLGLMKERLVILRNLLREDGFIACHIDDSEGAYLKVLMDEIFGRENYQTSFYVRVRYSGKILKQDMNYHKEIEQIHIYRKEYGAIPNLNIQETGYDQFRYYIKELDNGKIINLGGKKVEIFEKGQYKLEKGKGTEYGLKEIWASGTILDGNSSGRFFRDYLDGRVAEDGLGVLYKVWGIGNDRFDYRYFTGPKRTNATKGKYYQGVPVEQLGKEKIEKRLPINNFFDLAGNFGNCRLEGGVDFRSGKKPEILLELILKYFSNPNDIILDSFLGSGTTAAVAHKMNRKYIGIEMGEHVYTHCKVRLDKIISGEDKGGITKNVNWQGGGAYRFYELAPTLINKDKFGEMVINKEYSPEMLANAVALHEGYNFNPNKEIFWKQSKSTENSYLFVTTKYVDINFLNSIKNDMEDEEYLVIACKNYDKVLEKKYSNIEIKKIPEMLLEKCEFNVENYNLNIINTPIYEEELGSEIDE